MEKKLYPLKFIPIASKRPWGGNALVNDLGKEFVVCDDEGNYHGELGCKYEQDPWSGLSYALAHEGWGKCLLCTDNEVMGGLLFSTAEVAAEEWNRIASMV